MGEWKKGKSRLKEAIVRRKAGTILALAVIACATVIWVLAAGSPTSGAAPNSGLQTAVIPGDYVGFTCSHSVISIGGTVFCDNQTGKQWDMCDTNQCLLTGTDSVFPGYYFSKWTASSDAFFGAGTGGAPCSSSQSSTANPVTLCFSVPNMGNKYGGTVTAVVT